MERDRPPFPNAPEVKAAFERARDNEPAKPPEIPESIKKHAPGLVLKPGGSMRGVADDVDRQVRQQIEAEKALERNKLESFRSAGVELTKDRGRGRDRGRDRGRNR